MKRLIYLLIAGLACHACSTDFEVLAPEKEIIVVYGVLDAQNEEQFIKVSKVFQFEGDAYAFASMQDLSLNGLDVRLSNDSTTWIAEQVPQMPKEEGMFLPVQSIYRFHTEGNHALVPGETYTLEIRRSAGEDLMVTAHTRVPLAPEFIYPTGPYHLANGTYVNPTLDFNQNLTINLRKGMTGTGYELRLLVDFLSDGTPKQARWGPTPVFTESVRCGESISTLCYGIPKNQVLLDLRGDLLSAGGEIEYPEGVLQSNDPAALSRTCILEATAVDSFLTTYLRGAQSFGYGLNMLMDKPEYSNLSGPVEAVGIFGSIHRSEVVLNLGICSQYLCGLKQGVPPNGCTF